MTRQKYILTLTSLSLAKSMGLVVKDVLDLGFSSKPYKFIHGSSSLGLEIFVEPYDI